MCSSLYCHPFVSDCRAFQFYRGFLPGYIPIRPFCQESSKRASLLLFYASNVLFFGLYLPISLEQCPNFGRGHFLASRSRCFRSRNTDFGSDGFSVEVALWMGSNKSVGRLCQIKDFMSAFCQIPGQLDVTVRHLMVDRLWHPPIVFIQRRQHTSTGGREESVGPLAIPNATLFYTPLFAVAAGRWSNIRKVKSLPHLVIPLEHCRGGIC